MRAAGQALKRVGMAQGRKLELIDEVSAERDRVMVARRLPLFSSALGTDDLACGRCGGIIASGVDAETLYSNLQGASRLIVDCTCGAHNLLVAERRKAPR